MHQCAVQFEDPGNEHFMWIELASGGNCV
jgi:hypothetical protein